MASTLRAIKQSTACWREDPAPKFLPAATISPGFAFFGKSFHPSRLPRAYCPISANSVMWRKALWKIWSVSISSISVPDLSVRTQMRPRCDVVSMLEVLRTGDMAQNAGCGDDGGASQIRLALPLLAGEIAVPCADLNFALARQADMALGAAAAAGVDHDRAGLE